MFDDLGSIPLLRNASQHDAALVLATPEFAKMVYDKDFIQSLTKTLAGSGDVESFSLLCGVVDHIAPTLGSYSPAPGISVLRSHQSHILPYMWQPESPLSESDADTVSALSFSLGDRSLALPLARTTFHNSRASTLVASKLNCSSSSAPTLDQQVDKRSQHAFLPIQADQVNTTRLWAPLVPLTARRILTESFGNIIRTIDVDGQAIPASTELESVVNTLYSQGNSAKLSPGGEGIWALVVPPADTTALDETRGPGSILEDNSGMQMLALTTMEYVQDAYASGGRLYKICEYIHSTKFYDTVLTHQIVSGGGGWGAKKGLLSLDPQVSHFAFTEEEEMQRFMRTMENSGFAAPGSTIQFLMSMAHPPPMAEGSLPSFVFGVPGQEVEQPEVTTPDEERCFIGGHFGALSSDGVFMAPLEKAEKLPDGLAEEMKLSVPNSRVYIANEKEGMSTLGKVAAGSVADAGFLAMLL